jgi:hypothetical protein
MKFVILMTDGGGAWDSLSPARQAEVMEEHGRFRAALEAEGKFVASYQLSGRAGARTARRDARGGISVIDGPFAETKEVVGGFYVIEADSLDEALEWAKRSRFITGSNEVRALIE